MKRALFGLGLLVACGPPTVSGEPLKAPTTGEAFEGVQCSAVRPQSEPDLMGWDPGSRLKLARLRDEGVVAVRYQATGCNVELEVLPCVAGGPSSYTFKAYRATEHKVAHNASELFAQLPVGAARLAGSVKGDRALRTDYMLAGQYGVPTGAAFKVSELRGPRDVCKRATHVVSAVYVGAFSMTAGESRAIEASASLLGAEAGAKSRADVESLGEEGNAEACKTSQAEAKEDARCAVPLRIALLALEGEATAPTPAGASAAPSPAPVAAGPAAREATRAPGLCGGGAHLASATTEAKALARTLYRDGVRALEVADYPTALRKLCQAQTLIDAPTHLYRIGIAYQAMGNLVEARRYFEATLAFAVGAEPSSAFVSAQEEAKARIAKLPR